MWNLQLAILMMNRKWHEFYFNYSKIIYNVLTVMFRLLIISCTTSDARDWIRLNSSCPRKPVCISSSTSSPFLNDSGILEGNLVNIFLICSSVHPSNAPSSLKQQSSPFFLVVAVIEIDSVFSNDHINSNQYKCMIKVSQAINLKPL